MASPDRSNVLDDFDHLRKHVLGKPLAAGIRHDEVAAHLAGLQEERFACVAYAEVHARPLIQPRGGFPTFRQQRNLTLALAEAGADFIPLTVDSYTRHNDYERASYLLGHSEETGNNYLNGYPLVSHGYELTRRLFEGIAKPVCLRHGTPDARLLAETAIAAGITEIEGGGLSYCIPYSKSFPIDQALLHWQYVDRLCATYSKPGHAIHRESFGPLTATLVPPFMVIAVEIIEFLLALEQGVTSFSVGYGQTGSLAQDIATAALLRKLPREYAERFGFGDVDVRLVYHQWMGAFPSDPVHAQNLIAASALIAGLVGADKIVIKTRDEARGIPSIETNCEAVRSVRYVLDKHPAGRAADSTSVAEERQLIESETRLLLERIFELPDNTFWESVHRACREGLIDIPFAPHLANANRLVTVRDGGLAIRVRDPGSVPMSKADRKQEAKLLASVTDSKGHAIAYEYDDNGNLSSIEYEDGTREVFTYDGVGNMSTRTNRRGETITYTHNAAGQVLSKVKGIAIKNSVIVFFCPVARKSLSILSLEKPP